MLWPHAHRNLDQRRGNPDQAGAVGLLEDTGLNNLEFKMDMQVKKLPAVRVAYMRYTEPYGTGVLECQIGLPVRSL